MKKYVLDTNVLLNDPDCLYQFQDNQIILPITVIEEMDRFKKDLNEVGRNARQVSRNLDELRKIGSLHDGVDLPNGGKLLSVFTLKRVLDRLPYDLDENKEDNRILAVAIEYKAILVTKDTNLRIKADALGVVAEDYQHTKVNVDDLYTGVDKLFVPGEWIDEIYKNGCISLLAKGDFFTPVSSKPNQCYIFHDEYDEKKSALVRYDAAMKEYKLLSNDLQTVGLEPRNAEQRFALDLLRDPSIQLVSLIGTAGSGKTLMALAAGLNGVMHTSEYKKLLLLKPVASMDNSHELGFLPGTMNEKLAPWMASYYDNIEFIMGLGKEKHEIPAIEKTKTGKKLKRKVEALDKNPFHNEDDEKKEAYKIPMAEFLIDMNMLEIGSLEHIRGRSLPNQYIILDECQNMTINSIKTVITRAGEGTKIVLLGDISQIDVPFLDAESNGLTYVADRFKEQDLSGHITLQKSERSKLAQLAAELL